MLIPSNPMFLPCTARKMNNLEATPTGWLFLCLNYGLARNLPSMSFRLERSGMEESTHYRCCLAGNRCVDPSTSLGVAGAFVDCRQRDKLKFYLPKTAGGNIDFFVKLWVEFAGDM